MICSLDELGLQDGRAEGIFELETTWSIDFLESKLGTPFFDLSLPIPGNDGETFDYALSDTIFEIDNKFITNRPDLFGTEGNAREFGALFSGNFQAYAESELPSNSTDLFRIETDKALAYNIAEFENVTPSPSPLGLQVLMHRTGLTVKNALVDFTNAISMELGQPMHAFDREKVSGTIVVRMAKAGEKIEALDGKTYELAPTDIVIADSEKVLAIAGVIGGASSAVSDTTRNVLVESATFDPVSIRMTAQRLACRTDASTRYEKSIDPLLTKKALVRSRDYLAFFGFEAIAKRVQSHIDVTKLKSCTLSVSHEFIEKKLGVAIESGNADRILRALGFAPAFENGKWNVTVPSHRVTKDISRNEDIVEEVGRVNGYDNVPDTPIKGSLSIAAKNSEIMLRDTINSFLSNHAFFETYNYSFSHSETDRKLGYENMDSAVRVQNAFNTELTHMRRSILGGLLSVVETNLKRRDAFSFYEIGKTFTKNGENDFSESRMVGGVAVGMDVLELRDILDGLFHEVLPGVRAQVRQSDSLSHAYHPNGGGVFETSDGVELARFGTLHPEVASEFRIGAPALVFEMDFEAVLRLKSSSSGRFSEISKFQDVSRELNFIADERVSASVLESIIAKSSPKITGTRVVDTYRDVQKIGENKKSVTFSFLIQDFEKTVTDEEAMAVQNAVIANMEAAGYPIRK